MIELDNTGKGIRMKEPPSQAKREIAREGGAPTKKNIIQQTGNQWMDQVMKFQETEAQMKKHAGEVYNNIIESHSQAAKKQMHTFAQEMIKIKKVREEHAKIAENAKKIATSN